MKGRLKFFYALPLLLMAFAFTGCTGRPEAGEACVVRNGGPFDNKNIRQILHPGVGTAWVGIGSSVRCYPAAYVQRYYTITSLGGGDRPGVDVVHVQTADGVQVGIEGTFYFNTAWDFSQGDIKAADALLKDFDTQFGTRTFPGVTGGNYHPYDGDRGWSAFLDAIIRPQIDNELRQAILKFDCAQIISSCVLIQSNGQTASINKKDTAKTNVNLQQIQDDVDAGLKEDIRRILGEDYFNKIHFQLVKPTLPDNIQQAVNEAQAAFASVSKAHAAFKAAEQQKLAAQQLAKIYESSPQLAAIEQLKILCGTASGRGGCSNAQVILGLNPSTTVRVGK